LNDENPIGSGSSCNRLKEESKDKFFKIGSLKKLMGLRISVSMIWKGILLKVKEGQSEADEC
jgi:hypothetical protein